MATELELNTLADMNMDDVPVQLPDNTYRGVLLRVKALEKNDGSRAIVFTYQDRESKDTIDEWKDANPTDEPSKKKWLKRRLLDLGVPENEIGSISLQTLVGTPVVFTIKSKDGYSNVTMAKVDDSSSVNDIIGGEDNGNRPANTGTGTVDF